jgi:protein O-mannosyl-transferase
MDRFTSHFPLSVILLLAAAACSYARILQGEFQYDDFSVILTNPHLDRWQTFVGHLDHMVRPLLHLTFFVDRMLYGDFAAGYHVLNFLLHAGSGILVFRILSRAVNEEPNAVPFWVALLFLIHPLQTETVTYISGRASGLMAFGYLLALFLYIKATENTSGSLAHRLYRGGALLCFMLSLSSKETAITFPLALLLWDIVVRRLRGTALRAAIVSSHLPFWLVLLVAGVAAWSHPRYIELAQFSLGIRPIGHNLVSELHAATVAMGLFFFPWMQSFDHNLPILHSLLEWPLPFDLLIWCGLGMTALVAGRRLPLITFGIGWFFVQLLPTSLIPRNDLLSERNLYLASMGLLLVVAVAGSLLTGRLTKLSQRPRFVQTGAGILACTFVVILCVMTFQRNGLYRDPVLLWSDTVEKSPQKARPHNNLGHVYAVQGDWGRAIDEFRIAARLDPNYRLAQENLRDAYLHQVGRP